ncbi:MAG: SUMF1/EgtB/PvdO family nonheme iron enzyme [Pirellulaceae bacterium]|nr:SUMF1/EgtB/PvdO family nonheme iron enzyme [Pirellulaceae bacterium]
MSGPWMKWQRKLCWAVMAVAIAAGVETRQCLGSQPGAEIGLSDSKPAEGPYAEVAGRFMVPYSLTVPGSNVVIHMIPIPGGVFEMGGSQEDQSPLVRVQVPPVWVAKTETTWQQYELYMSMYRLFNVLAQRGQRKVTAGAEVDAVTAPTELYDPTFTYEYGQEPDLPAVTMTQYAAKQYTKWLSKLTGHQYRLPTEAEWEYACRAGTTTEFSFGADAEQLSEYGWFADNSDDQPHPVGEKRPNAFGLQDMHGNVMEWTISGYTPNGYTDLAKLTQPIAVLDTVHWSGDIENRVLRGGSWQDAAEQCACAARLASGPDSEWKEEDPNLPLSPWWFTSDPTRGVGFRIFRSYHPLDEAVIAKFWEIDHQYLEEDVDSRLKEGRGIRSVVDPELAQDIRAARP